MITKHEATTIKDRPEPLFATKEVIRMAWPEFMQQDEVANQYWNALYQDFPQLQVAITDVEKDKVIAAVNSVPLCWNDSTASLPETGWDWALEKAFQDQKHNNYPNLLCALAVSIALDYRGKGISSLAIQTMRTLAKDQGMQGLIVPVRPSLKSQYPLTSMEKYIRWQNNNALPFDPWIRVHVRLDGRIQNVCSQSMRITGNIAQWEDWTGMCFPESGEYIIPNALVPLIINKDIDQGVYVEPNVWIVHIIPK